MLDAGVVVTVGVATGQTAVGAAARAGVARRHEAVVIRAAGRSPVTAADTATGLPPEPASFGGVFVP